MSHFCGFRIRVGDTKNWFGMFKDKGGVYIKLRKGQNLTLCDIVGGLSERISVSGSGADT